MEPIKLFIASVIILIYTGASHAQSPENYYFSKTVNGSMDQVTVKVKTVLKEQGFGIITEIDMKQKLEEKLGKVDIQPYKILGACNPAFALETLKVEENIGLFLPCKVLVKQIESDKMEVVMVNPSALMRMLGNDKLVAIAAEVTEKFEAALREL